MFNSFAFPNQNQIKLAASMVLLSLAAGVFSILPPKEMALLTAGILLVFVLQISIETMFLFTALLIFVDVSFIGTMGHYIRFYQLIFLALMLKFVWEVCLGKRQLWKVPLILLLNLWVASYFLSYTNVLDFKFFWVSVIGQLFLNGFYFAAVQCMRERNLLFFKKVVKYMLLSGVVVATLGILEWLGFFLGINIGISHYQSIGIPRPSSFASEPDWYGLFCSYVCVWFLVLYLLNDRQFFQKRMVQFGLAASGFGVFISMARASILGVCVAAVFLFILTKNIKLIKISAAIIILMGLTITTLFFVNKNMAEDIYQRLDPSTSLSTDHGAADSRLASIHLMLDYIRKHPIIGNGSGGMAYLSQQEYIRQKYIYGGELNQGKGNANIFLGLTFDSGFVGLALFLAVIMRIIYLLRAVFHRNDVLSLALSAASLLLLVDFNFNNGFRLGFVWLHLAFVTAYFLLMRQKGKEDRESEHGKKVYHSAV